MSQSDEKSPIDWREWSREAFDEARRRDKLVLLDLSAEWCHWCHVMDTTTYADPEVAKAIKAEFVPVRVDIDRRPDISERYNRGGFPTTAFLSDQGESVWGATYIPPADMKRIMRTILEAKASGEVREALERSRMRYLDLSKAVEKAVLPGREEVESLFEDIFATYDVEHGGFGIAPKFPHHDALDLLLVRYAQTKDEGLAEAAVHTLDRMTDGLYDPIEGGAFRYSVTRDWREPHYEKMLETNVGFLGNLVHAHVRLGHDRFAETARGIGRYLLGTLRDPSTGGFSGSQDADERYYKLSRERRLTARPPSVVKRVYAGWNAEAASALISAGAILGESDWVEAGRGAWRYSLDRLWNDERGLIRHSEDDDTYLFEDQVSFLGSIMSMLELSPDQELLGIARRMLEGVERTYPHPEGGFGDIQRLEDAIGELGDVRRSLVSNARWARLLVLLGAAEHDRQLEARAREILGSFSTKEVESYGLFAAEFVNSFWALSRGVAVVEIHTPATKDITTDELWLAAKRAMNPSLLVLRAREQGPGVGDARRSIAVVCTSAGCSKAIDDPLALSRLVAPAQSSQV